MPVKISAKKFEKRVKTLQKRLMMLRTLMKFVKRHKRLFPHTELVHYPEFSGLRFEGKGYIKALWDNTSDRPILQLERYAVPGDSAKSRVVMRDISQLSAEGLANLLETEIKVDVRKPYDWDPEDSLS